MSRDSKNCINFNTIVVKESFYFNFEDPHEEHLLVIGASSLKIVYQIKSNQIKSDLS